MSEKDSTVLLDPHLKQLKLPTIFRKYVSMAATCSAKGVDFATHPLRLTERELFDREQRAAAPQP